MMSFRKMYSLIIIIHSFFGFHFHTEASWANQYDQNQVKEKESLLHTVPDSDHDKEQHLVFGQVLFSQRASIDTQTQPYVQAEAQGLDDVDASTSDAPNLLDVKNKTAGINMNAESELISDNAFQTNSEIFHCILSIVAEKNTSWSDIFCLKLNDSEESSWRLNQAFHHCIPSTTLPPIKENFEEEEGESGSNFKYEKCQFSAYRCYFFLILIISSIVLILLTLKFAKWTPNTSTV